MTFEILLLRVEEPFGFFFSLRSDDLREEGVFSTPSATSLMRCGILMTLIILVLQA
jgi:hypothetical protein